MGRRAKGPGDECLRAPRAFRQPGPGSGLPGIPPATLFAHAPGAPPDRLILQLLPLLVGEQGAHLEMRRHARLVGIGAQAGEPVDGRVDARLARVLRAHHLAQVEARPLDVGAHLDHAVLLLLPDSLDLLLLAGAQVELGHEVAPVAQRPVHAAATHATLAAVPAAHAVPHAVQVPALSAPHPGLAALAALALLPALAALPAVGAHVRRTGKTAGSIELVGPRRARPHRAGQQQRRRNQPPPPHRASLHLRTSLAAGSAAGRGCISVAGLAPGAFSAPRGETLLELLQPGALLGR